jgi:hypothetical protein
MLEQIRRYLRQNPFSPFEIHCSNGDVFFVESADSAAVLHHFVTIALPDGQNVATINEHFIASIIGSAPVPARSSVLSPRYATMSPRSMYASRML